MFCTYSQELRTLLSAMRTDNAQFNATRTLHILSALQAMAEKQGPEVYFHFTGDNSAIMLPAIKRWPYNTGFSVNMWLWIEPSVTAKLLTTPDIGSDSTNPTGSDNASSSTLGSSGDAGKCTAPPSVHQGPHVYAFCTASGQGYIARIVDSKLVLSTTDAKGNTVSVLQCSTPLQAQQW